MHNLTSSLPRQVSVAIEGVGETGTRADADLVAPFLGSLLPRNRRSALRALAKLEVERAISSAIAALGDDASSVRSVAIDILSNSANSGLRDREPSRAVTPRPARPPRSAPGIYERAEMGGSSLSAGGLHGLG